MCTEEWRLAVSAICGFCNTSEEDLQAGCPSYVKNLCIELRISKNDRTIVNYSADLQCALAANIHPFVERLVSVQIENILQSLFCSVNISTFLQLTTLQRNKRVDRRF